MLTTGGLATALGVSQSAVLLWVKQGIITPELTTPGGHHRWDEERVRQQLRERRQRDPHADETE